MCGTNTLKIVIPRGLLITLGMISRTHLVGLARENRRPHDRFARFHRYLSFTILLVYHSVRSSRLPFGRHRLDPSTPRAETPAASSVFDTGRVLTFTVLKRQPISPPPPPSLTSLPLFVAVI